MWILFSHSVGVWKRPVLFAVHKFSRPGTANEYVISLEGRWCDGRFSSVTCAEDN